MTKYNVVWFPFCEAPIIETDNIEEAKNFIEEKYMAKSDVENRRWYRVDDGYVFRKSEPDGTTVILNKKFEYGIRCEKTTDEFDYLFNK